MLDKARVCEHVPVHLAGCREGSSGKETLVLFTSVDYTGRLLLFIAVVVVDGRGRRDGCGGRARGLLVVRHLTWSPTLVVSGVLSAASFPQAEIPGCYYYCGGEGTSREQEYESQACD